MACAGEGSDQIAVLALTLPQFFNSPILFAAIPGSASNPTEDRASARSAQVDRRFTYINISYSLTIVSAMIDAGFLLPVDRSDNGKVRAAIMRLIDVTLRDHIASVAAKEDAAKKVADNSWGNAPIR